MKARMKKAAGGFKTTTATASNYATNFIAAGAGQTSAGAAFRAIPCAGIDRRQYRAVGGCATVPFGAEHTITSVLSPHDSGASPCAKFKVLGWVSRIRKVRGEACYSCSTTQSTRYSLNTVLSGFQFNKERETMTTVNTPTTPKMGNPSPLTRQQAIENALSGALQHARSGDLHSATGRAMRAASMLKQACAESTTSGRV